MNIFFKVSVSVFIILGMSYAKPVFAECSRTFETAVERQLTALDERDLEAYMAGLPERKEQLIILPDGDTWSSRDEIREGHEQWFKDKSWVFNRELLRKHTQDNWGVVVYRAMVNRPDKPGAPFLLSMMFASEKDGCWYLQHDQNTLLPEGRLIG